MDRPYTTAPFTTMDQGNTLGYEAHYSVSHSIYVTQYHCHDYYEIYLHRHGGEYMGLDDSLYRLTPNQIFIIPPFHMHGLACTRELHDYERAYLNLSPEVMKKLGCDQVDLDQFFQSHATHGHSVYQLSQDNASLFVSILRQIRGESNSSSLRRLQDYSLMISAINLVCQVVEQEDPLDRGAVSNSIIQNVLSWINTHYTEDLKIQDLSRRFNISPSYLSHEFARFTNRSVYDYILYRRVMLSCQMMLDSDNLNTIAFRCGFNDYSNFLRAFSKIMGISPSRYRKQQQYQSIQSKNT